MAKTKEHGSAKEVHLGLRISDELDKAIDKAIDEMAKDTGVRVSRSAIVEARLKEAFGVAGAT